MFKKIFLYCSTFLFLFSVFLWIHSYWYTDGISCPWGKEEIEIGSLYGRIHIGKYYHEKQYKPLKFHFGSSPNEIIVRTISQTRWAGIMVDYPWDWPKFEYTKHKSSSKKYGEFRAISVAFPHWLLLLIFGPYPIYKLGPKTTKFLLSASRKTYEKVHQFSNNIAQHLDSIFLKRIKTTNVQLYWFRAGCYMIFALACACFVFLSNPCNEELAIGKIIFTFDTLSKTMIFLWIIGLCYSLTLTAIDKGNRIIGLIMSVCYIAPLSFIFFLLFCCRH